MGSIFFTKHLFITRYLLQLLTTIIVLIIPKYEKNYNNTIHLKIRIHTHPQKFIHMHKILQYSVLHKSTADQ